MRRDIKDQEIVKIMAMLSVNNIDNLSEKEILDIGCGDGRLSHELAKSFKTVYGIDPIEEDIQKAKSFKGSNDNIQFKVADAVKLPFEEDKFDLVIFSLSLCCMEEVEIMSRAIKEAWRVLKQSGYLLNLQPAMSTNFNSGVIWYLITGEMNDLTLGNTQESRFALKVATHIDKLFTYVNEDNFTTMWSHQDKQSALESWMERYQEKYDGLDITTKNKIEEYIESFKTENGIVFPVDDTLTLIKKAINSP